MLLVHKSRRTSSRVFSLSRRSFASPLFCERFSTNDKRNFFSWNNIWSWPFRHCFSLTADHNMTGLFCIFFPFVLWIWLMTAVRNCHFAIVLWVCQALAQRPFSSLNLVFCSICAGAAKGCDHFIELFIIILVSLFVFFLVSPFWSSLVSRFDLILIYERV